MNEKTKIQWRPIGEVHPYPNNPRNNDEAVEYVANSLREFGWQQPIVVDTDGTIIAGHTRLKAAKLLGMETVPVVVADNLTPARSTPIDWQTTRLPRLLLGTWRRWPSSLRA